MGPLDVKVTSGQVEVSKEKNLLVWVLGVLHFEIQTSSLHMYLEVSKYK